jgi:hypothetical protein
MNTITIKVILNKGKEIVDYFLKFLNLREILRLSACNSFLFKTIKTIKCTGKLAKLSNMCKLNRFNS